jgi:hypothetical protein
MSYVTGASSAVNNAVALSTQGKNEATAAIIIKAEPLPKNEGIKQK